MGALQALQGLWLQLRLAMLTCLLAAHRAAQAQPAAQQSARSVSARILGHMQAALQHDWLLVGGGLSRAGGLCSAWYRRRDPQLNRAALWCAGATAGCCARCPRTGWGDPSHTGPQQLQCRCRCDTPTMGGAAHTTRTCHPWSAYCLMGAISHPTPPGELSCARRAPHPL